MDRRQALGVLVAAGLAPVLGACTSDGDDAAPTSAPTAGGPPVSPRQAAAVVESGLVVLADRVVARHPSTGAVVGPVRDAHAAHLTALGGPPATAAASTSPGPASTPVAATPGAALLELVAAERSAARTHVALAATSDSATARLLASLGSYAAAQDVVLGRAAR